jgi:hypothetical protein
VGHSKADLAAFQDGETRLVYARYRDQRPGLYFLVDGNAREQRAFAKEHLTCIVPDCRFPELTTVGRARGRDGFRHFAGGGGHEAESLFHMQAKIALAEWLRAQYSASTVREEESTDRRRSRVADVMITATNGKRVAFEIQYASLTPADWTVRHQSYVEQDIQDVWLFGHYGAQMRPNDSYNNDENVKLNPTHRALVDAGLPLLWFNPIIGEIATATDPSRIQVDGQPLKVPAAGRLGNLETIPLDDFRLMPDGLWSQTTRQYARNRDEVARIEELEELKRRQAAEAAVEAERQRVEHLRQAQHDWEASSEHAAILAQYGRRWPSFLDVPVEVHPRRIHQDWQTRLFNLREAIANVAGYCDVQDFVAAIPGVFESEGAARRAVKIWFTSLAAHHYLRSASFPAGQGKVQLSYILTSPEEWAKTQREQALQIASTRHSQTTRQSFSEPNISTKQLLRTTTCQICRMPLHPTNATCMPY